MPGFGHGVQRIFAETISGFVMSVWVDALAKISLLDTTYVFLFKFKSLMCALALISVMSYWGFLYLLGWLFGLLILAKAGLIGPVDFLIYFVPPLIILILRVLRE